MALAACAVDSPHDVAFVSHELEERAGVGVRPADEGGAVPPGTNLDDGLSEGEAVAIALWNNKDFAAVLADLDVSRAELVEAGAFRNPVMSMLLPLGPNQFELTLSLPLDSIIHRPRRIAAARAEVERVAVDLVRVGLDLIRDAQLAYAAALLARERVGITEVDARLQDRRAALARARAAAGDASEAFAAVAEITAGRTRHDAARARFEAGHALLVLRGVLGLPADMALPVLVDEAPSMAPPPPLPSLLATAIDARPDVRAAELALRTAGERVGLTRSELWQIAALAKMDAQNGDGDEVSVGFAAELPLLDWRAGALEKADAQVHRAALRYEALRFAVAREVDQAWHAVEAAGAELVDLRQSLLPASDAAIVRAARLVEIGEEPEDVELAARQQGLELRAAVAATTMRMREARAALAHSVGRRFEP